MAINYIEFLRRKQNGLCVVCGSLKEEYLNGTKCQRCLDRFKIHYHRRHLKRSANHQCIFCGASLPFGYKTKACSSCKLKRRGSRRSRSSTRIYQHLCVDCNSPIEDSFHKKCLNCRKKSNWLKSKTIKKRIEKGLCLDCGVLLDLGLKRQICDSCAKKRVHRALRRKREYLRSGLCSLCGSPRLHDSIITCDKCYFKLMAKNHLGSRKKWEFLKSKLDEQSWKCPYSGRSLELGINASVEHILPYSRFPEKRTDESNIEWMDEAVNKMKNDMTKDEFIGFIRQINHWTSSYNCATDFF